MNNLRRERLEYEFAALIISVVFHMVLIMVLIHCNFGAPLPVEQKPFRFKVSKVQMPLTALPPLPEPAPEEQKATAGVSRKIGPPAAEKFAAPASVTQPGVAGAPPGPMPAPAIPDQLQIGAQPLARPAKPSEPARSSRDLLTMPVEKPGRPVIEAPRSIASNTEMPAPEAITEGMLKAMRSGVGGTGTFFGPVTQPLTQIFGPGSKSVEQLMKEAVRPPPPRETSRAKFSDLEPNVTVDVYTWHDPAHPEEGYFQVRIGSRADSRLRRIPKDVFYVVDVSGSIGRQRVEQFKTALHAALMQLNPEDRFDIIQFRYDINFISPMLLPASAASSAEVQQYIAKFHAMGTTDFFASTLPLAQLNRERGRLLMGVVLSDGLPTVGELDALHILHRFAQINGGRSSVFTFAGGADVDLFLLGFLAYRNQGELDYVKQPERIAEAFARDQLAHANPLLLDCQFRFAGINGDEVFPRVPPHLFRDTPMMLYGRYPRAQAKRLGMQLRGINADGQPMEMTVVRDLPAADNGTSHIATDWATQKINHLLATWIDTGDQKLQDEAIALGKQFNVPVPQLRK